MWKYANTVRIHTTRSKHEPISEIIIGTKARPIPRYTPVKLSMMPHSAYGYIMYAMRIRPKSMLSLSYVKMRINGSPKKKLMSAKNSPTDAAVRHVVTATFGIRSSLPAPMLCPVKFTAAAEMLYMAV